MSGIFQTILYQPLFNVLVGLYNIIPGHDLGVAIIVITVLVRGALWPLTQKAIVAQKKLQALQPHIDESKVKHKDDKQAQAAALMELYKEHKINPLGSCLPLLLQIPVFIALYWVLGAGLKSEHLDLLYSFMHNPGTLNTVAFGFLPLSQPSIVIAVLAGLAQFWQGSQLAQRQVKPVDGQKDESMGSMMNTQLKYMMPVVTVIIGIKLAAGLTLYWFFSTFLYAAQQHFLLKKKS